MFEASKVDDADPAETREWLESIDSVLRTHGAERAQYLLERVIDFTPVVPVRTCRSSRTRPTSTRFRRDRSRNIPVTVRSRSASRPTSAGTRWRWSCRPIGRARSTVAISRATPRPPRCTRWASITSGVRRMTGHPGDMVFIQGHSSPGIYARAYLEGRLDRRTPAPFPRGSRWRRSVVVSASVADAGFLAVPDGVDGSGPDDGDLPGTLRPLPGASRDRAAERPQGLGIPRRRRNGRAGIARRDHDAGARETRQPGLRHQLQPAATRRARCAATARSSRNSRRPSSVPAGTSSRSSGARAGIRCCSVTTKGLLRA